jgi:hypothetical protein
MLPEWDALPKHEKYANMARQGHGFLTSLPVRIIKPDLPEGEIVDVAKNGKEIGEIVFSGNICCKEYYKDPEATRKLFAGGVLHSGDLAVWHPDGSIQIQDRAKDIIISGNNPPPPYLTKPPLTVCVYRRRKHLLSRPRVHAGRAPGRARGGRRRRAG